MAGGRTTLPTWLTTTRRSARSIFRLLVTAGTALAHAQCDAGRYRGQSPGVANEDRFSLGVRGWAQATFLLYSRFEAISAPARNVASLAHTTSSVPIPN